MDKSISNIEKIIYTELLLIILLIFNQSTFRSQIIIIFASFLNLRLIIKFYRITPLLIFFLFSFSYILPFFYFFFYDISVSAHEAFNNSYYLGLVIDIYCLFLLSIFIFSKTSRNYVFIRQRLTFHFSSKKYYFLLIIILILVIIGLKGQSLLSGDYGSIVKIQSPLYEYTLIFLSIAVLYVGKSKFKRNLLLGIILIIIGKALLYGGRVTSVEVILLSYILLFEDRIPKKWILAFLTVGFIFMRIFVVIRSNPILFLSGDFTFIDFFRLTNSHQLSSNQGDVAQASARIIGLIKVGILSTGERVSSLFYSILSVVTPGVSFSNLSNLASFKQNIYSSGGGGLFPVYFFAWLSYLGVFFAGYIVSKIINTFITTRNNYYLLFTALVMSTFPRWLAYNPIVMVKLCFYVIPIYYLLNHVKFSLKKET